MKVKKKNPRQNFGSFFVHKSGKNTIKFDKYSCLYLNDFDEEMYICGLEKDASHQLVLLNTVINKAKDSQNPDVQQVISEEKEGFSPATKILGLNTDCSIGPENIIYLCCIFEVYQSFKYLISATLIKESFKSLINGEFEIFPLHLQGGGMSPVPAAAIYPNWSHFPRQNSFIPTITYDEYEYANNFISYRSSHHKTCAALGFTTPVIKKNEKKEILSAENKFNLSVNLLQYANEEESLSSLSSIAASKNFPQNAIPMKTDSAENPEDYYYIPLIENSSLLVDEGVQEPSIKTTNRKPFIKFFN